VLSDIEAFAETPSTAKGRAFFSQVGCVHCHTPSFTYGRDDCKRLLKGPKRGALQSAGEPFFRHPGAPSVDVVQHVLLISRRRGKARGVFFATRLPGRRKNQQLGGCQVVVYKIVGRWAEQPNLSSTTR
jgi:hypothetical protein